MIQILFKAAQVSLGALGVIASVTLRVVPAKRLRYQTRRERLQSVLSNLERYKQENSHFEFFWMPYTPWTQAKFTNETDEQPTSANLWTEFNRVVMENGVFWALSEGARVAPPLSKTVSAISAWGIAPTTAVDYSHRLFATPRAVRFQEMEYNIPAGTLRGGDKRDTGAHRAARLSRAFPHRVPVREGRRNLAQPGVPARFSVPRGAHV